MKNIHVLPTEKPSRLLVNKENTLVLTSNYYSSSNPQNIYITSDEEIKEGDWFIRDSSIHKCFRVHKTDIEFLTSIDSVYCGSNTFWSKEYCKKIILTTDQELIKDGVQAIDDDFLEWFVKNPSCEFVEVTTFFSGIDYPYEIIIPKEELHSMDDEVECNMCGGYMYLLPDNSMYVCTNSECTRCYEEEDEEPEQETLEEVNTSSLENLLENNYDFNVQFHQLKRESIFSFAVAIYGESLSFKEWQEKHYGKYIEISKWQQEQDKKMYGEQDMKKAYHCGRLYQGREGDTTFEEFITTI